MPRSDLTLYRRFLPLLSPYRGRLLLALAASGTRPLLSAARIWLLKVLIDTVIQGRQASLLPLVAGGFLGIALLRGVLVFWSEELSGWVGTQVIRDLRVQLYAGLQGMSLGYFHGQRLGDLLTRISGDIGALEDLLVGGLNNLVAYSVTIMLFLGLLLYLDPSLMLVSLGVVPLLALSAIEGARRGRAAQRDIRDCASRVTSTAEEGLSAIALVKAFARAPYEQARFGAVAGQSAAARLRSVRIRAVFPPMADLIAAAGTAAVVWIGAQGVIDGRLSLGSLVVFISYLGSLYTPMQGISALTSVVQRALVGADRVVEVLDAPAALHERRGGPALPPVAGAVEFQHVSFGYTPGQPVLRDVSFSIRPGEMVGLVGASGAGKTTIVSLLLNYYAPNEGAVCLDGHPLDQFDPDSVREQVAAVLQEPMLFNCSVRENIRYGQLNATDKEIEQAARIAQADEFIGERADGYDAVTGPRGGGLSGGQRQRLAIARALVKAAPVLVLDEATSALDPATEARVLQKLRVDCAGRAILLVAHRYSAVSHADRVVVLDHGRVAEEGTHSELLAHPGPYQNFVLAQTQGAGTLTGAPTGPT
ncbi:MAG TPA: ABC transporter ATP-binding protein [Chloroflexota bacterium]|nr:ABC transporter ATP-binding protein [Chloroflexota bacterium]